MKKILNFISLLIVVANNNVFAFGQIEKTKGNENSNSIVAEEITSKIIGDQTFEEVSSSSSLFEDNKIIIFTLFLIILIVVVNLLIFLKKRKNKE